MQRGRDFTNFKLLVFSSQEPDAKRQRVDDASAGATNALTDTQANNSAYNYNWYQVGFLSEQLMQGSTMRIGWHKYDQGGNRFLKSLKYPKILFGEVLNDY